MSECVFELNEVVFRYKDVLALNSVSLSIRKGERVAVIGANGSGKSTLLRLMDALAFPSGGQIRAFDQRVTETAFSEDAVNFAFRKRVGFVFQNPDVQLFNPTVLDEIAFGPLQLGWSKGETLARANEILERFGMAHLRDRSPHRLSGGEKKRVALASVLVMEPEVVLLDEPTASLDPESQAEVVRFLIESKDSGRTIVTATHDLDIVEEIADRVIVMDKGRIAGEGHPSEILMDGELLLRTRLAHAHWHFHADGKAHQHIHTHRYRPDHHDPLNAGRAKSDGEA